MKKFKLKKIVAAVAVATTLATLSPIGASAAWKQDSNGWWNTEGKSYSIGWRSIDGAWYYFNSNGYMKTGWVNDGGTWYYMQSSGAMKTGWVNDGGTWYYLQSSGAMKTGWVYDGGTWYYLQPSGAMKTGWINDNGVWYFAASSGAMQTGVVEVDGKIYYLAPSGAMQKGNVIINGVTYTFALSGEAIGDKKPTPTLAFTSAGVSVIIKKPETEDTTSSGGGGGGGTTNPQVAIDNLFKAQTKVTIPTPVDNNDGTVTVTPKVNFVLGQPATTEVIKGVTYSVKKDINVSIDGGTDVGITSAGLGEYKIEKGKTGTITTVISLLSSDGKLYYVSSESVPFQS